VYFSIVSIWEIAIKYALHKQDFVFSPKTFYDLCVKSGYGMVDLAVEHIFATESLRRPEDAPKHRDPFDRLLLAQAKVEGMCFLSHDGLLKDYGEPFLVGV